MTEIPRVVSSYSQNIVSVTEGRTEITCSCLQEYQLRMSVKGNSIFREYYLFVKLVIEIEEVLIYLIYANYK